MGGAHRIYKKKGGWNKVPRPSVWQNPPLPAPLFLEEKFRRGTLKLFFCFPFHARFFLWKNERDFEVGKILFLAKDSSGFDVSVFYRQCSTS